MVWTCRMQHRLDCRSTQAECGCTEKIWQAKEIIGWSAWEWQKEARYEFCRPSKWFWVERTPLRKTCQKAQPLVEENRALKWIWWWWQDDETRVLIRSVPEPYAALLPTLVMLHIKSDQDWPSGFRDIQVWKRGWRRRTIGILYAHKVSLWLRWAKDRHFFRFWQYFLC